MERVRTWLVLAVLFTLGLLGWELCLVWLLSGDSGLRAGSLESRLARDAVSLFLVWTVALACAWALLRRKGRARTGVETATAVSLCFLLVLLPVAIGRGLQRQWARASTEPAEGRADRFLCAAVSPDVSASSEAPGSGSLAAVAWAGAQDALLLQVPVFPLALLLLRRRSRPAAAVSRPVHVPLALLVALGTLGAWKSDGRRAPSDVPSLQEESGCLPGAPVRTYAVAAIAVDLPLNAWGDHVPQGLMYALEEELPAIREQERRPWPERIAPDGRDEPIQPLVLRANIGECLVVHFTNRLARGPAALRIEGLRATVRGQGQVGGFVPGTSVGPGERLTYALSLSEAVAAEGLYLLHDSEDGGEREARGLFGALVVEPAGAVYRDASTGAPSPRGTGWAARIDVPSGGAFREMVLLYHAMGPPEVADVRSVRGALLPVLDEMAGPFRVGAFGVNYRSDPRFEREDFLPDAEDDGPRRARGGRETPRLRSYLGETVKLRVAHAGSAEYHVHHLHGWDEGRGRGNRSTQGSAPEVPQLLSPGRGLTLAAGGTEGFPREAGDFVVHCHVPNHSTGGERLYWRVFSSPQPHFAPLPGWAPPAPRAP